MAAFMDENFLLKTPAARKLFFDYASQMPIIDYHCHLSPLEIYENRGFENLTQAWLGGDHYKWRLMRAAGVEEKYITGDAPDREKFQKYAEVLSRAIGNPLYHWSHLELQRFFGWKGVLRPGYRAGGLGSDLRKAEGSGNARAQADRKQQRQARLHHGRPCGQPDLARKLAAVLPSRSRCCPHGGPTRP